MLDHIFFTLQFCLVNKIISNFRNKRFNPLFFNIHFEVIGTVFRISRVI